ncbi:MAG: metal ABC transporter permease [Planctomycetota bacterium]|nr:metal ABC transporter permease [Planctomycetota bacterium]
MTWMTGLDDWVVALGVLAAFACALPGTFLLLRGMSMMGDAISHAILPGIALGFLVSGSRDNLWMFLGAAIAGVVTAVLTQVLHRLGRLERGAAMGVVFTSLFALGLILIVQTADHVDLDPNCVLYGAIELAPLDTVMILGMEIPRAVPVLVVVGLINLLVVVLFYKEMKISAFDPDMARSAGINAGLMNQVLMVMTAATCVACFEVVGSILVVSLLVAPAAAARLISDRLPVVLILAVIIGAIAAALGHISAITVPGWFPGGVEDTSTAGMMAVLAGVLFGLAWILAPRHGLLVRSVHRLRLQVRIVSEDALGLLFRSEERGDTMSPSRVRRTLVTLADAGPLAARLAVSRLQRRGLVYREGSAWRLSEAGRSQAAQVVRSHRLWETWLWRHADLAADHVHDQAMRLEHVTDDKMRAELEAQTDSAMLDPHGRPIPSPAPEDGNQGESRPWKD